MVEFVALLITVMCRYPEITQEAIAPCSSPCKPWLLVMLLISFFRRRESSSFPFLSRRCCGFEISLLCVDVALGTAGREMLICAGEDGVMYLYSAQWGVWSCVTGDKQRSQKWVIFHTCNTGVSEVANQNEAVLPSLYMYIKKWGFFSTYHIFGYLVSREILNIFVFLVDYFWEPSSIDDLFKYPHLDSRIKSIGLLDIFANDSCYGRSPLK